MINRMPQYSQAPVKNYLETGNFKDHAKTPIPAEEVGPMTEEFLMLTLGIMSQDNTQADSNPAEGIIQSKDQFFGDVRVEFEKMESQDPTATQGFGVIGTDTEGAVGYARNTSDALDIVIVSNVEGSDDGVIHLDQKNPENSFMTLSEDMASQFIVA